MKLVVGLGNPEGRYTRTRHNAGFLVVDRLLPRLAPGEALKARFHAACAETQVSTPGGSERVLLMKPTTYMNRSGLAVGEAVAFHKLDPGRDLLVVTDDFYLPVGTIRLKPDGGTGGHNGLADIDRALAGREYPRLRVGVGLAPSGGKPPLMDQADFVLSVFTKEEEPEVDRALARAAEAAEMFLTRGLSAAMNAFNAPPKNGEAA